MQSSFEGSGSESAGLNQKGIVPLKAPIHANYIRKAQLSAVVGDTSDYALTPDDLYVVWFAKTLRNWKALVSTDVAQGLYWEVTYNGDKGETYVDTYVKQGNQAIPDSFFEA